MKNSRRKNQAEQKGGSRGARTDPRVSVVSAGSPPARFPGQVDGKAFAGRAIWIVLCLIAVNVLVYAPAWHYDFVVIDDPIYVSNNPQVAGGLSRAGVAWAFTTWHAGYWIPLIWLSHMLDVQLFGMDAGLHHVTNLLLHVASTILLFWLLFRMTGAAGRSAFVAALFAVHPLHVESVVWVTERKDVLSTLFWLLALWAYTGYAREPRWDRYLRVLLFAALGLMAKPMLVTLPFVLLLLDVWPLRRVTLEARAPGSGGLSVWIRLVREKVPIMALAAISSVLTYLAQRHVGAVSEAGALPFLMRLENALASFWAYLGKMLWPARLAAFYPYPESFSAVWAACELVGLLAVSVLVIRAARRFPYLAVGWLWYVGTLVPVIGLVQVGMQGMADRFTYVPLIGIFIMIAWGVPDLPGFGRFRRIAIPAVAVLVLGACAITARAQVRHWQNSTTLLAHAIEARDDNWWAHEALGEVLQDQGRQAEAFEHFTEAVRIKPGYVQALLKLGGALLSQGKIDQASGYLAAAVKFQPGNAEARSDYGDALTKQGKTGAAADQYRESLRLKPEVAEVHRALGRALVGEQNYAEALNQFAEALRIKPEFAEACNDMGSTLSMLGKTEEALASFSSAVRLKPEYAEAQYNLGTVLAGLGRTDDAVARYNEALRLRPDFAEVQNALGLIYAAAGRMREALFHFSEAVRLKADYAAARYNFGVALAGQGKTSEAISQYSEAVQLKPDYEFAHLNLGLALARSGRVDEAIREFTAVLQINPQNKAARAALDRLRRQ